MTFLSKKLEKLIRSSPEILPVKTEQGILVGKVLIQSEGTVKNLLIDNKIVYREIHLNVVAIKLANLLAKGISGIRCDEIYRADQEYGKWFIDSQVLRTQFEKFKNSRDFDRADMLWARYCESRNKTIKSKKYAESLANI